MACNHADEHNAGRDHVVDAVLHGSEQRGRVDARADRAIKRAHPQLDQHGQQQYHRRNHRKGNRFGVQDAGERGLQELHADHADDERDDQSGDVLGTSVAERVLLVGCTAGQLKAHDGDKRRQAIRQVVDRVGCNRNRTGSKANDEFCRKQQEITEQTDTARQDAVSLAHPCIARAVTVVAQKATNQQFGHNGKTPLEYNKYNIPNMIAICKIKIAGMPHMNERCRVLCRHSFMAA